MDTKSKIWLSITSIALVIVMLGITFIRLDSSVKASPSYAAIVNTTAELNNAIKNASNGDTIALSDTFTAGDVTLVSPNVNVSIDGQNKSIGSGTITINNGGTGSLTFSNLKFESVTKRPIEIYSTTGQVLLDNIHFDSIALQMYDGAAIYLTGYANVTIKNCTFTNNSIGASGYSGGAIGSKNFSGTLNLHNSTFINNKTLLAGTGALGGEGGAIFFNTITTGSIINITDCYFNGNQAVKDVSSGQKKLADGGAIALFNIVQGATLNIEGTTFYKNIAGDDGGAILIQTNSSVASGMTLKNNTFYQNVSQGLDLTIENGGAIQLYANGGMFDGRKALIDFESNSFVSNVSNQRGGAIAGSGYATNLSGGRFKNNILIANTSASLHPFDNVSNGNGQDLGGNLGYDNGVLTTETMTKVFGNYPVVFGANMSAKKAGYQDNMITIPTLPIAPQKDADEIVAVPSIVIDDQRGFSRSTLPNDSGAVEIDWIKYDANGGNFTLNEISQYDGTEYYEGIDPTIYYRIGYITKNQTIESGLDKLGAVRDGYTFLGWSYDKDATTPDSLSSINFSDESPVLYAVWEVTKVLGANVTVNYVDENGTTISPEIILTGKVGDRYDTEQKEIVDYTFKELRGNSTGAFTNQVQVVTYIYTINSATDVPETGVSDAHMSFYIVLCLSVLSTLFLIKRRKWE